MNKVYKINFVVMVFIISTIIFLGNSNLNADTMSSSNYKVQVDSLNFGGTRSSSGAYIVEDTLGETATGVGSSTNYIMGAGYQQMQLVTLSTTPAGNVTMSPSIGGVSGGVANGSTNFTVTTDDMAGYVVTIVASTSPALQSATSSFADYVPATANPDYTFTNADTASSFAFAPEGSDIHTKYKYSAGVCNVAEGNYLPGDCWDGLSTSPKTIISRASSNHPNGTVSTINFRAASGSRHVQMSGVYTATTTITILPL